MILLLMLIFSGMFLKLGGEYVSLLDKEWAMSVTPPPQRALLVDEGSEWVQSS